MREELPPPHSHSPATAAPAFAECYLVAFWGSGPLAAQELQLLYLVSLCAAARARGAPEETLAAMRAAAPHYSPADFGAVDAQLMDCMCSCVRVPGAAPPSESSELHQQHEAGQGLGWGQRSLLSAIVSSQVGCLPRMARSARLTDETSLIYSDFCSR